MVQTFGLPRHTFGTNVSPKRRHTHQPGFVAGYLPAIERIDALAALAGALHRSGSWRSQYSHRSAWRVNQTVPKMRTDPVAQAFRPAWGGRLSRLALPAEPIRDQFLHASVSEHRQRRGRSPKPRVLSATAPLFAVVLQPTLAADDVQNTEYRQNGKHHNIQIHNNLLIVS
jgi:hypothetical protein